MTAKAPARRCAVYTRKSSEEGLEQDFNSLHAQREACEAFIRSQRGEGWRLIETAYDDGGLSGGTLERPALQRLFADIAQHRVDTVVVYKVDRLTRSLMESSCDRRRTTAPRTDRPSPDQDRGPSDRVDGTEAAARPRLTEVAPQTEPPILEWRPHARSRRNRAAGTVSGSVSGPTSRENARV